MDVVTTSGAPQDGTDLIRLICEGKKALFVSRSLLIRKSTYFSAALSEEAGWQESSNKAIELEEWLRNDLAVIMQSLKTKEIAPIIKNMHRYFPAINYFSITSLMDQCIESRINSISDGSVIDDIDFANRFSLIALREKCVEYLLKKLPDVINNSRSSRRKMTADLLDQLLRNEKLVVYNEDEVLSMIDIWSSSGQRQSERTKLLEHVQFALLTEKAFEKCRQDPQCLEVPQFRRLLETPHWSDLKEELVRKRRSTEIHYHVGGFLGQLFMSDPVPEKGFLVYCSKRETLSPVRDTFSEAYAASMVNHLRSVMYGNKLYVFQRSKQSYYIPGGHRASPRFTLDFQDHHRITEVQHFADFNDSEPSWKILFPNAIFAAAPPAASENGLVIAHLTYEGEPLQGPTTNFLATEKFVDIEILRYHNGESSSRRIPFPTECEERPDFFRDLATTEANKLVGNDEWKFLFVPRQGLLLVIDSPRPVGSIIEIPEKYWNLGSLHTYIARSYCDLVIVENVAFVLLKFILYDEKWHPSDHEWVWAGSSRDHSKGTILAYDLTEGKWLPGDKVDLANFFSSKKTYGGYAERFTFFLRAVQNEVFVISVSSRTEPRQTGFPLEMMHYVYRLERSADDLSMSPVSKGAGDNVSRSLRPKHYSSFKWQGMPLKIDACPCEHATALHLKANREKDPIEREKLRRFIW